MLCASVPEKECQRSVHCCGHSDRSLHHRCSIHRCDEHHRGDDKEVVGTESKQHTQPKQNQMPNDQCQKQQQTDGNKDSTFTEHQQQHRHTVGNERVVGEHRTNGWTKQWYRMDGFVGENKEQIDFKMDIIKIRSNISDTALTLACVGGHTNLVSLLIKRGAHIEHRDKKGFTPLILATTGGHLDICKLLVEANAQVDAQADRTKDTALSLACSGGRKDVSL